MKESYERVKLEIFEFQPEDVIMTSGEPIVPEEPQDHFMLPIR